MRLLPDLSDERRQQVLGMLTDGSNPRPTFFFLVAISTLIASFGLVTNSTAVVIGAMLVAPLMTPILGLGLALVRGDHVLMGYALRSEIMGVFVALLASVLLGLALPHVEATPEMLARTHPNLMDLLVAVLSGMVGTYALVDERLSPVLPGVAIATAIVPPLANSGLCLSIGAHSGAWGSFLLFFTNFLSILLISAVIFYLCGMVEDLRQRRTLTVVRRFGLAVLGFILVSSLLSSELIGMVNNRRLQINIQRVLTAALSRFRVSGIIEIEHQKKGHNVFVLAHVHAPTIISPRQVKGLEAQLEKELKRPIELYLRTTLTRDVSAPGAVNQVLVETLDGLSFIQEPDSTVHLLQTAEQVIHEYLGDKIGMNLKTLEAFPWGQSILLMAEISGIQPLKKNEIGDLETLIQARLNSLPVILTVRQGMAGLMDKNGIFRAELAMRRAWSPEETAIYDKLHAFIEGNIKEQGYVLLTHSVTIFDGTYHMLYEIAGPTLFTLEDIQALQAELDATSDVPTELFIRSVPEVVMSAAGYTSIEELLTQFGKRTEAYFQREIREHIQQRR